MITEKQIEKAAYEHAYQNPLFGSEHSFAAGAKWAAEKIDPPCGDAEKLAEQWCELYDLLASAERAINSLLAVAVRERLQKSPEQ